ncbi:MAG TPA: hypothetical protein PL009_07915 [Flavipsychrobacter sp.]|nr:hypothetical protein [Flavipsychrobacter sp.]
MRYLLAIVSLLILFTACNKKGETTVTREDELRSGKWKMIAGTHRWDPAIGKDTTIHYYDSLPACKKDDYLIFANSFAGTQNSGEKCDLSEPEAIDFRWYLENNGTKINFYNAFQTFLHQEAVSAPFLTYGPSEFSIRYFEFVKSGIDSFRNDTVTYTYTFRKQ